jgi:hypothetical protein
MWLAVGNLLIEIRQLSTYLCSSPTPRESLYNSKCSKVNSLYTTFVTCLDDLPSWLIIGIATYKDLRHNLKCSRALLIRQVDLIVLFHCLSIVIIQKFEDPVFAGCGLSLELSNAIVLRKTEIARDILQAVQDLPFWAGQVSGESCVSRCYSIRCPSGKH